MRLNPIFAIDGYKVGHIRQYPAGTEYVYSNFTPRSTRVPGIDRVVFFGLQAFLQDFCTDAFAEWFARPEAEVVDEYQQVMDDYLGPGSVDVEHIRALHRLGYLPLRFCALPEGTLVPLRVPMFTVENMLPEFYWLTNYIESVLSAEVWMPITTATTAWHLRRLLDRAAAHTGGPSEFVDWQGHDFSLRGMTSLPSAAASGAGHLLSFTGTDSIPSLQFVRQFYPGDNGLVGGSVPATEHSVMCAGGEADELETFERLLRIYPTGILSVVSDTWNLWDVALKILSALHDAVVAREGKLVVRPDSGDPVDIICGDPSAAAGSPEHRGLAELLWDEFGGSVNAKGFKELDPHIGMIYGDSITYERAVQMTERLAAKGFASTNIVLGVGSFSYQYVTRDTFGMAMKATWAQIDGVGHDLFKDPITDNGVKKSATGRLAVQRHDDGVLQLIERATADDEKASLLAPVWENGEFVRRQSFADVRAALREETAAYEAGAR